MNRCVTLSLAYLIASVSLQACGGSSDSTSTQPPPPTRVATTIAIATGNAQIARIKSVVPVAPSVVVKDQNGAPLAGVTVTFAVSGGAGTVTGTTQTTDANGVATIGSWTLGPAVGQNSLTATASGGANPSTQISATGRLPYWTVMVYMAADNTLAVYGVINLLQMAQAGVNPEVQVVVQAEFSPEAFSQAGFTPAMLDRPNYNTFRYVMDGSISGPPSHILIGPATDIGNVNMTDPATLRAFVQWGEQTAPAQRTVLVLWNHGGDQAGLIEDLTSAPGSVMSLSQLTTALSGLPTIDVLYFEMCLMAGYEPLSAVHNLARAAVASEDAEYVAGWDFKRLLNTMYADPTVDGVTLAPKLADTFDAAYASLGLSETISAFNLSGFNAVDAAVSQLATALTNSSSITATGLAASAVATQRYEEGWVTDLADFTDTLRARYSDPAVTSAALAVKQAVTSPSFLLATHYRTGTKYQQRDESRSRGLTIVMPAGGPEGMPSAGTASMAAYQQQFPSSPWGTFLQTYTAAIGGLQFLDVGSNPLTMWQVWDTTFVNRGAIEMLLIEPDGYLYGPAFGSISPSGVFSADAQLTNGYYEGWASNEFVESGTFNVVAWLVSDSTNYQPLVNIAYRYGTAALASLYGPGTYPQLSMQQSFVNDPTATWSKVLSGAYSDLKPVAVWTPTAATNSLVRPGIARPNLALQGPRPTEAQLNTLRSLGPQLLRATRSGSQRVPAPLRRDLHDVISHAPAMLPR